ncbi:NAD(P)-binding protein [Aureobasidium melanogenum CBS 110374]|uniref:NAD(P)-binding protein n=1 Tax=Aureobasidium melanogenum (strain CBS 110374) TaxID=1043003 RepID=A0A074WCZ1_AURM1|nr:NAD(P)-binding protein [Aureobasidium melanogenum CBS 110374]KEQ67777.1 NAD(P)-binding protein [Aureobasidium melanogenum CBS 110374]
MTAAVLSSPGASPPSKCFTMDKEYPRPTLPSPSWVLVKVKAAGLNRAELRGRNGDKPAPPEFGMFVDEYHPDPPKILGEEFVGTVEEAGSETKFKKGELCTGFIYGGGKAFDGAYAEYVICPAQRLFRLPQTSLSWDVLGAITMSMWTAYGSLFEAAQLTNGATALIHGATSSVGVWAVLLAKDHGCTVIATTRKQDKAEKLKSIGADHVVLEEELNNQLEKLAPSGVDCLLELVGPDTIESLALPNLAKHGSVVVTGVLTKQWAMKEFTPALIPPTRKMTFYSLEPGQEEAEGVEKIVGEVVKKVESGTFKPEHFLDKTFPLEKIGEAHEYMEDSKAVGKVVVTIP